MADCGCEKCVDLCLKIEIRFPAELSQAIRLAGANLADGTIVESSYWPEGEIKFSQAPFSEQPEKGPWDDVFQYYFECPACGQLFRLTADTYHGGGGSWKPVSRG